jgi:hypothetical protein
MAKDVKFIASIKHADGTRIVLVKIADYLYEVRREHELAGWCGDKRTKSIDEAIAIMKGWIEDGWVQKINITGFDGKETKKKLEEAFKNVKRFNPYSYR